MPVPRRRLPSHLQALLACLALALPTAALAQDAGTARDAGMVPDASVGEGGPDRDNPEGEDGTGRVNTTCRSTSDCSPRFTCQGGSCRYTGVRTADAPGCLFGPEAALLVVGVAALAGPRRRRR